MFPFLAAIATGLMHRWQKDLIQFLRLEAQDSEIEADLRKRAQRKILDLPLMSALVSLFTWFLAGVTMATHTLIAESGGGESFTVELVAGLRVFVGCLIGGIITASIIYFISESKCRQI